MTNGYTTTSTIKAKVGGCPLPKGHNMGKADIPENHQRPAPVPSDEEISNAVNSIMDSREGWERSQAIVGAFIAMGQRIGVKL